jgi:uncharacterized membrane protein
MIRLLDNKFGLLAIVTLIFIITEALDTILDRLLGVSLLHTIIQLLLFLGLLYVASTLFLIYHSRKVRRLISKELMDVLQEIKDANGRGIMINQQYLVRKLHTTKPTMRKRLERLYRMHYIAFEKEGNNKHIIMTREGKSLAR